MCKKAQHPLCHIKQSLWPSQPWGRRFYIPTLIKSPEVYGHDKANKWLVITVVISRGVVIRDAIHPIWNASSRAGYPSLIVPEWLIVSGSAVTDRPCLYGGLILKALPPTRLVCKALLQPSLYWLMAIRDSLHTVINPRPVTSISTHNSIRKQAEWRIMKPAPGLGIMARHIRAGRG